MRIFIFVEGPSDKGALATLFEPYRRQLRDRSRALAFVDLKNKGNFLSKIGPRAAQKLAEDAEDCVAALPDLYPNRDYANTRYAHANFPELQEVLTREVREALAASPFRMASRSLSLALSRFYPCALKHDLEMLLLAAWRRLGEHVRHRVNPSEWIHPVEDQDQNRPPKRIVEEIFLTRTRRAYRDTRDAPAVLRRVADFNEILYRSQQDLQCPVLQGFLDWLAQRAGVRPH